MDVPVMRVKRKADGEECIIDVATYDEDPDNYEPLRTRERLDPEPEVSPQPEKKTEQPDKKTVSREELSKMTIDALQKLPQWKTIPNPKELSTKDAIIDAILAVS